MKVKKSDCIGQIVDFPVDIVQAMVDHQVNQGNQPLVSIFQIKKDMSRSGGGFNWSETVEGVKVWSQVLNYKNFDSFYEYHNLKIKIKPVTIDLKEEDPEGDIIADEFAQDISISCEETDALKFGDLVIVKDEQGIRRKRIFITEAPNIGFICIPIISYRELLKGNTTRPLMTPFANCEKVIEKEYVYLTLEDISQGKGVGILPHLLKIKKEKKN